MNGEYDPVDTIDGGPVACERCGRRILVRLHGVDIAGLAVVQFVHEDCLRPAEREDFDAGRIMEAHDGAFRDVIIDPFAGSLMRWTAEDVAALDDDDDPGDDAA